MSPSEQIQALRDLLKAGKVADEKASPDRLYLRGFNGGIEYAQMQMDKIFGREVE